MPASIGMPARKTGIRETEVTRQVNSTVKVTRPTPNPAIRWTKASQVLAETSARSTVTGPARRLRRSGALLRRQRLDSRDKP